MQLKLYKWSNIKPNRCSLVFSFFEILNCIFYLRKQNMGNSLDSSPFLFTSGNYWKPYFSILCRNPEYRSDEEKHIKSTSGGNLLEFWRVVRWRWCVETEKDSRGHDTRSVQTCLHNSACQYQHPYPTTDRSHYYGSLPDRYKRQNNSQRDKHESNTKE